MEETGRFVMVTAKKKYKYVAIDKSVSEKDYTFLPKPLKSTSVSLLEVVSNKTRLEANAFNLDAKVAIEKVKSCQYGFVNLWSKKGLVKSASYPGRFKRIYVPSNEGRPFFLPSQLVEIKPKANKFISEITYNLLTGLEIKQGNLLMTRSGTIGKCAISSKGNIGKLYSDDVIRVSFKQEFDLGYTYAFFKTKEGQLILQTNNYGAVVKHIEPEHLESVIIPTAPTLVKKEIHNLIIESFALRDQSNDLIDKAEKILYKELQLPQIEDLRPKYVSPTKDLRSYSTKLSDLKLRMDSSYHLPVVQLVKNEMSKHSKKLVTLSELSERVILAGVFKRTYVDKDNGVPFLGGRDITQLIPKVEKFLSKTVHEERIKKELEVFENYVLISDRGTVGKVQIVPKHWEGWAVSQNIIKVVPKTEDIAGYLYCFLNSEYGQVLIKREIYGSVVDMVDDNNIKNIQVPLLKNVNKQKEINELVLSSNALRYKAYLKEESAVKMFKEIINSNI